MTLRLLSGGVDSLYLSVNGGARTALLSELEVAKVRAQHEREPVPFEFAETGTRMRVKPGGFAGWAYWLTSPELELWLGRDPRMKGPAGRVQFHSLYLHGVGPVAALAAVRRLLERDVCAGPSMLSVSRLDVYADAQGWRLEPADMDRFVTWANHRDVKGVGRRFTGFVFGQGGGMMARLYDKDAQMVESGKTWMGSYWRGRVEGERVWRLEFELRRAFMRRLDEQEPAAVLELVPALWRRCTSEWLTLRMPSAHAVSARWPVDPMWVEAQGLLGGVQDGRELVWRAAEEASEERVLAVLAGSFTTWAAMHGIQDKERAVRAMVLRTDRYLSRTGRTFGSEVRRKRRGLRARGVRRAVLSRHGRLSGLPKPGGAVAEPKAEEERESVPRIGRSARTARRARVGQSTFLGRPPKDTTGADSGRDRKLSAEGVSGGGSRRGWLEAQESGEAVNRRDGRDLGVVARGGTSRPRGTEGERRYAGEGVRAHQRGREDDGAGCGDGVGRAMAAVGAEPPSQPEGSEPNLAGAGRGSGSGGRERRRRRVRDGGDGGGCARQGTERTGRASVRGRAIPKRRRGGGRSASVSSLRGSTGA